MFGAQQEEMDARSQPDSAGILAQVKGVVNLGTLILAVREAALPADQFPGESGQLRPDL